MALVIYKHNHILYNQDYVGYFMHRTFARSDTFAFKYNIFKYKY